MKLTTLKPASPKFPKSQNRSDLGPRRVPLITAYLKDDHEGLAADVKSRSGIVLIAWEHKLIPTIAGLVAPSAGTPATWPDWFDLIWICDRSSTGWIYSERRQALLAGDVPNSAL
ncbi:hypothetical protein GCM10007874_45090 [Labrys miyagiensis]|uniref:Uncharacterized protein n=1 Tax=Labrys miyagiensis TaxID=346912 RepID=A0ABQ6CTA3_9HYPH|nr:hypothetical protein GCM10007874_45090 [Labrys miyagiensis]